MFWEEWEWSHQAGSHQDDKVGLPSVSLPFLPETLPESCLCLFWNLVAILHWTQYVYVLKLWGGVGVIVLFYFGFLFLFLLKLNKVLWLSIKSLRWYKEPIQYYWSTHNFNSNSGENYPIHSSPAWKNVYKKEARPVIPVRLRLQQEDRELKSMKRFYYFLITPTLSLEFKTLFHVEQMNFAFGRVIGSYFKAKFRSYPLVFLNIKKRPRLSTFKWQI